MTKDSALSALNALREDALIKRVENNRSGDRDIAEYWGAVADGVKMSIDVILRIEP